MSSKHLLYLQLTFTAFAFGMMVVLSCLFMSGMVRQRLAENSANTLAFEKSKIETALKTPDVLLSCFSETIRQMILQGDDAETIRQYMDGLSALQATEDVGRIRGLNRFFGGCETLDGETVCVGDDNDTPSTGFDPRDQPWYAIVADGDDDAVARALSYRDEATKQFGYIYSHGVYGDDGRLLGVVGISMSLNHLGQDFVDAAARQGAIGLLVSDDLTIVAHTNPDFVGKELGDPEVPISIRAADMRKGLEFSEQELVNYRGEVSIGSSRKLDNGWYVAIVSPKNRYYQSVSRMTLILVVMGTALAMVLMFFLVRIDAARSKADEESKVKSSFLANMSHEIRTPMNAIVGMTTLGKTAVDVERKDYCFDKIEEASHHLLGVINDILDISKIEANKFELSIAEFHFEKMLRQVANIIGHRVDEKRQKFMVRIDDAIPPTLIGDDQRIAQVVTNLLGNAVKFTPEEGTIRLEASLQDEENGHCTIRIAVTDTGIGISHEQQARLFQAFQQAESGTARQFGGTGLGLAIAKNIVEMMGGSIWVESRPGKGATFTFTVRVKPGTMRESAFLDNRIHWGNVSIMVVDDDPDILDYFKSVLLRFGTSCVTASSGNEALDLVERNGICNIYFVDWRMPDLDGIELARRLKEKSPVPGHTVVIMISGAEWRGVAEDAKKAGIDVFLTKPLFPSTIMDAVNKVLGLDQRPAEKKTRPELAGIFAGRHILLAEDMQINRIILQGLLEPTELTIDCVENGAEAVRMFQEAPEKYDLIFMDVQMPVMDGYEATRRIRALDVPQAKTIPIIAMTANVFREDVEECFKAGMNSHLGKPLNFDSVLEQLYLYLPKKAGRGD